VRAMPQFANVNQPLLIISALINPLQRYNPRLI
jgi:hypothetical protein